LTEATTFDLLHANLLMDDAPDDIKKTDLTIAGMFENVFKYHFKALHAYAYTIVKDSDEAEEIVQNVFFKIWKKKDMLQIGSITAYLYKAVYYESLNTLKHAKVSAIHRAHLARTHTNIATDTAAQKELQQKIDIALSQLPEQCRTVFQLSRFESLRYKDIAGRLGISVKTVENHMSKALRLLRQKLAEYLPAIILFINLKNILP
jgi:RNA polymerase sigma-70 factor (ECF subfamily)